MFIKKYTSLIAFGVGILMLVGCDMISGRSNEQPVLTDATKPTTISTATSFDPVNDSTTVTTLLPAITQTVVPSELCDTVPEPILKHPPDNSGEEFLSGRFYLCSLPPFSTFDFDEGSVLDREKEAGDIQFEVGKATFDNHIIYYIKEENASLVDEVESTNPSYAECKSLVSSPTRLGYVVGTPSSSGCIQTNKGKLGFFQITKMDPYGAESIEISFVVWNK